MELQILPRYLLASNPVLAPLINAHEDTTALNVILAEARVHHRRASRSIRETCKLLGLEHLRSSPSVWNATGMRNEMATDATGI
jgi:hypothetical protein